MKKKTDLKEAMVKLWEARKKGYAGGGIYTKLACGETMYRDGSRTGYWYEDRYLKLFSPETFAGVEILFYQDAYFWRMVYAGGMQYPYALDKGFTAEVYKFLKDCLRNSLETAPGAVIFLPRGPQIHHSAISACYKRRFGFLHYYYESNQLKFEKFDGRESIVWHSPTGASKEVFVHQVQGGLFK